MKLKRVLKLSLIFIISISFFSCNKENDKEELISGLWRQTGIEIDGQAQDLTQAQNNIMLLIENNGIYRNNSPRTDNKGDSYFGAWSVTDNKYLELTIDAWKLKDDISWEKAEWKYSYIPYRFTILDLNNDMLRIRIKAFEGEIKYASVFTDPELFEITEENKDQIVNEFKRLKTFIFTFKRK